MCITKRILIYLGSDHAVRMTHISDIWTAHLMYS